MAIDILTPITLLIGTILQLIFIFSLCLFFIVAGFILIEIYQAHVAFTNYKVKSKGIFMAKDRSIICNHTVNWGLRKNVLNVMMDYYKEHKQKTYGWLLHNQFGATTFDMDLMKKVVLDEPNKNINRARIDAPASEFMEDSIMLAEDDQWRRLRRAVAPALKNARFKSPNVMREIEASIEKLIDAIENRLIQSEDEKQVGIVVESDEMIHRFTLDVVFRCFYKQYDLIDFNAKHCAWTELVDEGLASAKSPIFKLGLMIHSLRKPIDWLIMNFHRQGEWRRRLIVFIQNQTRLSLEARKQLAEMKTQGIKVNEDDFLLKDGTRFQRNMADYITDHLLDGKITKREYFNTTGFLINAADKTVADALVHTLYRLAIDSKIQQKLRSSIENEGIECEYLDWVINESLRLLPPAPVACSRTIVDEIQLDNGHVLPAGTFLNYPNYIIHHMAEYWGDDVEEFKPERFAKAADFHPLQFVPFGAGIRACPGRDFALFEMKQMLSRLLLRYKFECKQKSDAYEVDSPFLVYILFKSPFYITIKRLQESTKSMG